MGSKKDRQRHYESHGVREERASEVWQDFKSKIGLTQEIFTGMSYSEKQFGRPETNEKRKKGGGAEVMQSSRQRDNIPRETEEKLRSGKMKDKHLPNFVQMYPSENRKRKHW